MESSQSLQSQSTGRAWSHCLPYSPYELWVLSRDPVPGAEFELEWVFIPIALRPYRVQAIYGWRDLGRECNTEIGEEAEDA